MKLRGKIALVAGATRGAGRGIAIALGELGATVYVTGRTSRTHRSDYNRAETIEETAELLTQAGGQGIALRVDHSRPEEVAALIARIKADQGRLHILVNDIWGGENLIEWNVPVWVHSVENGLRMLHQAIDTHLITAHHALPLLIGSPGGLLVEMTDGTAEYNATRYRLNPYYDLVKSAVIRMAWAHAQDLARFEATSVAVTPGWMRSEMMLESFNVSEATWHEAVKTTPHFAISETPLYVGRGIAALAADELKNRWNGQSLSSGKLAQEYGVTDIDGSQPDCFRYLVEVQEKGKPADVTGYR